jgi:hypothetical protein
MAKEDAVDSKRQINFLAKYIAKNIKLHLNFDVASSSDKGPPSGVQRGVVH